jgi:hypothetical protein
MEAASGIKEQITKDASAFAMKMGNPDVYKKYKAVAKGASVAKKLTSKVGGLFRK